MRNRIWNEITQSKHNIEFTSLYCERQRFILRLFNIGILSFSSAGIMGWGFWDKLPLVSCITIALISLLRLLQPHLIMSDEQLKKLDDIHNFYTEYFNKIEKLWYDFESDRITEGQAAKLFFKIKKTETNINPIIIIIIETIKSKPKKIVKKSKEHSDNYFKQIFNI
tara:strand:- start:409 stop:909 length:501 start_codon:yes stop_codon:yes gene_type:complete